MCWRLAFPLASAAVNNVKRDIFVFNVFIKVLLSMHKGKIMQHCSNHNNDEGIRKSGAQSQMKTRKRSL